MISWQNKMKATRITMATILLLLILLYFLNCQNVISKCYKVVHNLSTDSPYLVFEAFELIEVSGSNGTEIKMDVIEDTEVQQCN